MAAPSSLHATHATNPDVPPVTADSAALRWFFAMLLVLLVAACLRFWRLATLPQSLSRDEVFNVLDAAAISWQHLPIFFPANLGREPLFLYWMHLFQLGLGATILAARLAATFVALLTVVLLYRVVRDQFGPRAGLLAAAGYATLYWPVQDGRLALRFNLVPTVVLLTIWSLDWGARRARARAFVLAGVVTGIGAYTYTAADGLPAVVLGFICYLLVARRAAWRTWLGGLGAAAVSFAVVIAPLRLYFYQHPNVLQRVGQTAVVRPGQSMAKNTAAFTLNLVAYVRSLTVVGDGQWLTNLPHRPIFDPLTGTLCIAGLLLLVIVALDVGRPWLGYGLRGRHGALLFLLALAVMVMPGLVTEQAPYFQRVVGIVPTLVLAPAVALDRCWLLLARGRFRLAIALLLAVPLAIQGRETTNDFFVRWARSPETTFAFSDGAAAIGRYLHVVQPAGPLLIYSHDAPVTQLYAPRATVRATWLRDRLPLNGPDASGTNRSYYFDRRFPSPFETLLQPVVEPLFTERDPNTGVVAARGYRLRPHARLLSLLSTAPAATFDGRLAVTGARIIPTRGDPGSFDVVIGVRALRDQPGYLSITVRAVDNAGRVWAQHDGLASDIAEWPAGHAELSDHRLRLWDGTPPGKLHLVASVYRLPSLTPLPRDGATWPYFTLGTIDVPRLVARTENHVYPLQVPHAVNLSPTLAIRGYLLTNARLHQHDVAHVHVVWVCGQPQAAGSRLTFDVFGPSGARFGRFTSPGGLTAPAPDACPPNQVVFDRRQLTIGARWPVGRYTMRVSLRSADGHVVGSTLLGSFTVHALARSTSIPPVHDPIGARFANCIDLVGLTSRRPAEGHALAITLVWQAACAPAGRETVFVHLLGPNGTVVAQQDGPPANGAWPVAFWQPGQVIVDQHNVQLPTGSVVSGSMLEVGMYNPATGQRLPIDHAAGTAVVANAVRVRMPS